MVVPAGAGSVAVGAMGVGSGGFSPRHVVVIALSGCAQLMTPSIVSGISSAEAFDGRLAPSIEMSPARRSRRKDTVKD